MIDMAVISVVSEPGKPLILYCKQSPITDLLFSLLASANDSLFDIQLIVTQPHDLTLGSY